MNEAINQHPIDTVVWERGIEQREGLDTEAILEVMQGTRVGVLMNRVLTAEACRDAVARYDTLTKGHYGFSDPETPKIGFIEGVKPLFDYGDDVDAYLRAAKEGEKLLKAADGEEIRAVLGEMRLKIMGEGRIIRPMQYGNQSALEATWKEWAPTDGYAARLHDDRLQLTEMTPHHPDIELRRLATVPTVALVFYLEQGERGGETVVWNHAPTLQDWANQASDYGYPESMVARAPSHTFRAPAGSVGVFRSDLVHAVHGINGGRRITRNSFMAIHPESGDVIVWQ